MLGKPARRFDFRDDCEDLDTFARDVIAFGRRRRVEMVAGSAWRARPQAPWRARRGFAPPAGYAPKITRVPVDGITSFLGIVMCTAIIVFTPLQCMGMT